MGKERSAGDGPRRIAAALRLVSSVVRRRRVLVTAVAVAWIAALAVALPLVEDRPAPRKPPEISLSQALQEVKAGRVARAELSSETPTATLHRHGGDTVVTRFPLAYSGTFTEALLDAGVATRSLREPEPTMPLGEALLRLLPPVLLIGLLLVLLRVQLGGSLSPRGSRSRPVDVPGTRFTDVAGCAEAVADLAEIATLIREPERFRTTGARMPRGYLLVGPPGTGKTLLARAVAGEAGVPFFSTSGADFTDMYVGIGRRRIRSLFAQARRAAERAGGAVVFVDEIDAIGGTRAGPRRDSASDDRDATLIALLTEMDGFTGRGDDEGAGRARRRSRRRGVPTTPTVVVLAATNRPDTLDGALTRPGRFDRQIAVAPPDAAGRAAVLGVHVTGISLGPDVDLHSLARRTPGLVGADLENLVNEAAMEAGRRGLDTVDAACFEEALATVAMGRARTSALVSEHDRRITAWHEAGHAVAALVLPQADDPVSVTIVPRGVAGGTTWMDGNDHAFLTREQALARLAVSLGGRAGEELGLDGSVSQGAASDLAAATSLATAMATEYGMTRLGLARRPQADQAEVPSDVLEVVNELLAEALDTARDCLERNRGLVEALVSRLLDVETVGRAELVGLLERFSATLTGAPTAPSTGAPTGSPTGAPTDSVAAVGCLAAAPVPGQPAVVPRGEGGGVPGR